MKSNRDKLYERYTSIQTRTEDVQNIRLSVDKMKSDLRKTILPHVPSDTSAHILDLGCGFGALVELLFESGYRNVRGVDISPQQVETAHQIGIHNVQLGSLEEALQGGKDLDCILMIDVIEHLTREEALTTLQSVYSALRHGGTFILRTPNVDSLFGTVLSFGDITHEMHLNKLSSLELFAASDFKQATVFPVYPSSGRLRVRVVRKLITPIIGLIENLVSIYYGVQRSYRVRTPNMIIIAHKQ